MSKVVPENMVHGSPEKRKELVLHTTQWSTADYPAVHNQTQPQKQSAVAPAVMGDEGDDDQDDARSEKTKKSSKAAQNQYQLKPAMMKHLLVTFFTHWSRWTALQTGPRQHQLKQRNHNQGCHGHHHSRAMTTPAQHSGGPCSSTSQNLGSTGGAGGRSVMQRRLKNTDLDMLAIRPLPTLGQCWPAGWGYGGLMKAGTTDQDKMLTQGVAVDGLKVFLVYRGPTGSVPWTAVGFVFLELLKFHDVEEQGPPECWAVVVVALECPPRPVGKENAQQVFHHYLLQLTLIWAAMEASWSFQPLHHLPRHHLHYPSQLVPPQIAFMAGFGCEPLGNLPWTTGPFTSLKLPSPSRQFHLLQPPPLAFPPIPSRFTASASSSVATGNEKDQLPADIEVKETPEPNCSVRLSVEVPPAVCDDCYKRVLNEFMKQAKVPGFRPGKNVPESILISYVGKKHVQKATVESILKRTLPHAMSSVTGRALKDSVRIVTKFSEMEQTYSSLNSLSDIDASRASEQELRRRHKSLGSMRIVTDRGLQIGDVAVLDISATTMGQDESNVQKIPSAETKGLPVSTENYTSVSFYFSFVMHHEHFLPQLYVLRAGFHFDTEDGDKVISGFLDSIIGIQRGETKSFELVFPESWKQENLRGVHAQFTVECKELFYRDLPELDDSLADRLLTGCTTLKQVKESLFQRCLEVEQTAREQATDNVILDQLQKMVEADIPQSLFEEQGRQLYGAKLLQIQASMKLNEQQLASLSSPKAVNEYLENQKDNILNVIKQNLAVGDIYKRENLQFSTDELVKEVENSIAEFKREKQEYDEERVREQVQEILEGAKVLEWLKEHAEIQYITR
uniref:peptidylprolyl isomerase n=1 Tax=Fagus sylvatica TaxID=28930 RepID=A0A2N9HGU0_FAGSY